jgi:molecular chaperone GrpE
MDEHNKKRRDSAEGSSENDFASSIPASEVDKLKEQLEAKETEAKQNYDRFLRQVADFENFKKRVAREKEEIIRFANETLIKDLLPVLDNLERAVSYARGGGNGKPLLEGVELVLKGFTEVLTKQGLTPIQAKGEPFDPNKHEAIAQVETQDHAHNTVVEEHQKGYHLMDRLLRPSLVTTAKLPGSNQKAEKQTELEKDESDD